MRTRILSLALLAGLGWVPALPAQSFSPEEYVANLYRLVQGREARPGELNRWAQSIRAGTSPRDVHILFLASEEFWRRNGGDPGTYIGGLYQHLYRRPPRPAERQWWAERLLQYGLHPEGRSQFAKYFVTAAESYGKQLPATPTAAPERTPSLTRAASLFERAVQRELGPHAQGMLARANAVVAEAQNVEFEVNPGVPPTARTWRAIERLEMAHADARQALDRFGVYAPDSRYYLDRVGRGLTSLKEAMPAQDPYRR